MSGSLAPPHSRLTVQGPGAGLLKIRHPSPAPGLPRRPLFKNWGLQNGPRTLARGARGGERLGSPRRLGWGVAGAGGVPVCAGVHPPPASTAALSPGVADVAAEATWHVPEVREAKRVVVVRHGESTWNATGRIQGSSDFSELTPKGEAQAETSRQMLAADTFDMCFHSPLQRSAKTAHIIWGQRDAPMEPIEDLREIDLYSFQGLFKEEGKARYGEQFRMWQVDASNFEIDGHYPVRELWDRARICWDVILKCPAKSVLVVAHNAVNQALVATAIGLGPEYFRTLLQSNCGVSVLDFTPPSSSSNGTGTSSVSLNRLNQTPSPPVGGVVQSAGRKAKSRVILVCHGSTDSIAQKCFPLSSEDKLNMLGILQSRKTSELLLDVRVDTIFSSPSTAAMATAATLCEVQEAAECLGADCIPRFVEVVPLEGLRDLDYRELQGKPRPLGSQLSQALLEGGAENLDLLQERAREAWDDIRTCLSEAEVVRQRIGSNEGSSDSEAPEVPPSETVLAVSHVMTIKALIAECLGMGPVQSLAFNIDPGSVCVVDFPDGPRGRGVVRCLNYTAHLGRWAVPVTSPTFYDESF